MKYILKYSPEITIKSRPVRARFAKILGHNLRKLLQRIHADIDVRVQWDFVEITVPEIEAVRQRSEGVLSHTPGINAWERVRKFPLGDLDSVLEHTLPLYADRLEGKTFAVRCKRAGQHPFNSMDVERHVGGGLNLRTGATGVSLDNPEVLVKLEIRGQDLFVVEASRRGLGGFPLGSQDGVLSLISGGFDSAVASYLGIKRGLKTHYLFFNLGGHEHEIAVKEVAAYLWMKYGSSHRVKFVTVPFEEVVEEILTKVDNSQMGVVLKRMMLRAADRVARDMRVEALVTGESVAQVSSQTLANLALIDQVSETLVLRPLIMSEKQDIVDLAREIGTEAFSAAIPEYCGVISKRPTTRARRHRIDAQEQRFDFAVLERAVASRELRAIDQLQLERHRRPEDVGVTATPAPGSVILDIRHPEEEELSPLNLGPGAGLEVRKVPFYRLNRYFGELEEDKGPFLLYCGKGIMSRLHASYLLDQGHANVAVFHPDAGD